MSGMLEKSARISTIIQGLAALVFLYSYFFPASPQPATDPVVRQMIHPGWLPTASIIFLVTSVLTSAVLNFIALNRQRKIQEQIPTISVNGVPVTGPARAAADSGKAASKLVIHSALYGAGDSKMFL